MDTTRTSGPFELHAPGAFSPTVGDWVITSAKSPDPGTRARYTVVGTVPAHAEGTHGWEYPTDEELHAIALMFKAAPALLVACKRCAEYLGHRDCEPLGVIALEEARAAIAQADNSI